MAHLDAVGEVSLRSVVEANFRKVLLLVAASYFEWRITQNILEFVGRASNNNGAIVEFVKNKAVSRQFHSLFDWDKNNANRFFSCFGENFKDFMRTVMETDKTLDAWRTVGVRSCSNTSNQIKQTLQWRAPCG
jgi:hypothetical protein